MTNFFNILKYLIILLYTDAFTELNFYLHVCVQTQKTLQKQQHSATTVHNALGSSKKTVESSSAVNKVGSIDVPYLMLYQRFKVYLFKFAPWSPGTLIPLQGLNDDLIMLFVMAYHDNVILILWEALWLYKIWQLLSNKCTFPQNKEFHTSNTF